MDYIPSASKNDLYSCLSNYEAAALQRKYYIASVQDKITTFKKEAVEVKEKYTIAKQQKDEVNKEAEVSAAKFEAIRSHKAKLLNDMSKFLEEADEGQEAKENTHMKQEMVIKAFQDQQRRLEIMTDSYKKEYRMFPFVQKLDAVAEDLCKYQYAGSEKQGYFHSVKAKVTEKRAYYFKDSQSMIQMVVTVAEKVQNQKREDKKAEADAAMRKFMEQKREKVNRASNNATSMSSSYQSYRSAQMSCNFQATRMSSLGRATRIVYPGTPGSSSNAQCSSVDEIRKRVSAILLRAPIPAASTNVATNQQMASPRPRTPIQRIPPAPRKAMDPPGKPTTFIQNHQVARNLMFKLGTRQAATPVHQGTQNQQQLTINNAVATIVQTSSNTIGTIGTSTVPTYVHKETVDNSECNEDLIMEEEISKDDTGPSKRVKGNDDSVFKRPSPKRPSAVGSKVSDLRDKIAYEKISSVPALPAPLSTPITIPAMDTDDILTSTPNSPGNDFDFSFSPTSSGELSFNFFNDKPGTSSSSFSTSSDNLFGGSGPLF